MASNLMPRKERDGVKNCGTVSVLSFKSVSPAETIVYHMLSKQMSESQWHVQFVAVVSNNAA